MSAITEGHYYKKQLGCSDPALAWSHRSRFDTALGLLHAGDRIIDYGCGDGTFLALAAGRIAHGTGVDIAVQQVEDCQHRLADFSNLEFRTVSTLDEGDTRRYDAVFCMETLEHCTSDAFQTVLTDLARLVAPAGRVIISVPIETGAVFAIKFLFRKLAALRGLSEYQYYESYGFREAFHMLTATDATRIERPVYGDPEDRYHSHYGFNWRSARVEVSRTLDIRQTLFSPLPILRGFASSQAWFVCSPRVKTVSEASR